MKYLFSNDMRITDIEKKAANFAKAFLEGTVPSPDEDKSGNNNANTIGYYLNFICKGPWAQAAANGGVRDVLLNFVKVFQFPNPRTLQSYTDSKKGKILVAPLREVVKILFIGTIFQGSQFYLTLDEVKHFIFFNEAIASVENPNLMDLLISLDEYRKSKQFPNSVVPIKEDDWKHRDRQLREMISILASTGIVVFDGDIIKLAANIKESETVSAELLDIVFYNGYWKFEEPDNESISALRESYAQYCNRNLFIPSSSKIYSTKPKTCNVKKDEFQKIYYGAPGTGKSFILNKKSEEFFGSAYARVTFHPTYSYSHFVGVYKPFPRRLENGDERITYTFVPGPLLKLLIHAIAYPEKNWLLIIEEINRTDVSAVFGDMFQLLDRKNGESEYPIVMPDEIRDYLEHLVESEAMQSELGFTSEAVSRLKNFMENGQLYFPQNFYLWGTMNSADQGVKPIDTAFKRRWTFEYIDVDLGDEQLESIEDCRVCLGNNRVIKWNNLRKILNSKLLDLGVPEDKLMGPFFISIETLQQGREAITSAVINKVLMYLFEDAVKPYRSKFFADSCCKQLSSLYSQFRVDATLAFNAAISEAIKTASEEITTI